MAHSDEDSYCLENIYVKFSISILVIQVNNYTHLVIHTTFLWKARIVWFFVRKNIALTLSTKVVNTVPAGMYTGIETSTFRTGLNTSTIPVNFEQYWSVLGVLAGTGIFFYFFILLFFLKFCNFWIFVRAEW